MTALNPAERPCSIHDCGRPMVARGWCANHYRRWKLGIDMNLPIKTPGGPVLDRLAARYEVDNSGCWRWVARTAGNGYGQFWNGGRTLLAHRAMYQEVVGPIPPGLEIDHLCRNRACVNPDHLEPVTSRVNSLRGVGPAATNALKTECVHGHAYTPENTYTYPDGSRRCRECQRIFDRKRSKRKASR